MQAEDSTGRMIGIIGNGPLDITQAGGLFKQFFTPESGVIIAGDDRDLVAPEEKIPAIELADIRRFSMGPLPAEGSILEFDGLRYRVTKALGRGRFVIKFIEEFDPLKV